jgi:hypothetical protein
LKAWAPWVPGPVPEVELLRRCLTACLLLLLPALGGCDLTPSDPFDVREDLNALLGLDAAGRSSPHTLEGLLHAAVHRVYTEQGAAGARALVGDLRRLQEDARRAEATGDRDQVTSGMRAVQEEEAAIVLRVFGADVARRVTVGASLEAARLERSIADAEAAGHSMEHAYRLMKGMAGMIAEAESAVAAGDAAGALRTATRAAGAAAAVRQGVAAAQRIPVLADLRDLALATAGDYGSDSSLPAPYARLRDAADAAARQGDREHAQRAVQALREEEVRLVVDALGSEAARQLVDAVQRGISDTAAATASAAAAGRDVGRIQRMVATAREMNHRASLAMEADDPARALDLASHAAGLVNSARLALSAR